MMITFKFILSIIVGVLILAFFINFAYNHIATEEKLSALELINYLDLKLDILSTSTSSYTQFNLGKKENLNFLCDKLLISYNKEQDSTPVDKIISSPAVLKEKELQLWTSTWFFPFKITNFYFISNKKINFFIEDQNLRSNLPTIFNIYSLQSTSEILEKAKTSDKTIAVFSSQPRELQELLKNNIKVISILNENQLTFYPEAKTTAYLGNEMLYLAIFSQDYETYECLKQKAIKKLAQLSAIYKQKSTLLRSKTKQECSFIYSQLSSSLDNFPNSLDKESIETLNSELSSNDCPTIY